MEHEDIRYGSKDKVYISDGSREGKIKSQLNYIEDELDRLETSFFRNLSKVEKKMYEQRILMLELMKQIKKLNYNMSLEREVIKPSQGTELKLSR